MKVIRRIGDWLVILSSTILCMFISTVVFILSMSILDLINFKIVSSILYLSGLIVGAAFGDLLGTWLVNKCRKETVKWYLTKDSIDKLVNKKK